MAGVDRFAFCNSYFIFQYIDSLVYLVLLNIFNSSSAKPPLNTNKITSSHLQASIAANTEVGKQHIHLNSSNIANVNDANATNISIISSNKNKIDELIEVNMLYIALTFSRRVFRFCLLLFLLFLCVLLLKTHN